MFLAGVTYGTGYEAAMKIENRPDLFFLAVRIGSVTGQTNWCHVILPGHPFVNRVKMLSWYSIFLEQNFPENAILSRNLGGLISFFGLNMG